jgi:uncharacterized protein (TIGR00297 family)
VISIESVVVVTVLCGVLSALAFYKEVLTWDGSVAAFAVGMVIGIFGDVMWLVLLLLFLVTSFAATKYKFSLKKELGVQEGERGERRGTNVLANGAAPSAVAVLAFLQWDVLPRELTGVAFISAISVAAADTLASEIGVLSEKTYLMGTFKPVSAGTNGGVSVLGEVSAALAAVFTAALGWAVLVPWSGTMPITPLAIVVPAVVGFVGCQIDSVFGATLENRGLMNKKTNNLVTTAIGAAMGVALMAYLL